MFDGLVILELRTRRFFRLGNIGAEVWLYDVTDSDASGGVLTRRISDVELAELSARVTRARALR
jgi:hypothetical protein